MHIEFSICMRSVRAQLSCFELEQTLRWNSYCLKLHSCLNSFLSYFPHSLDIFSWVPIHNESPGCNSFSWSAPKVTLTKKPQSAKKVNSPCLTEAHTWPRISLQFPDIYIYGTNHLCSSSGWAKWSGEGPAPVIGHWQQLLWHQCFQWMAAYNWIPEGFTERKTEWVFYGGFKEKEKKKRQRKTVLT